MNQTIRHKQAFLQVMRERVALSTSEMYQKIGRDEPVRQPRFNVVPRGNNSFDVVERATGTSRGARSGHDTACQFAQKLEDNAIYFESVRLAGRHFARSMLRWMVGMSVILAIFAYYGAHQ